MPFGEKFVELVVFRDRFFVVTTGGIYEASDGKLTPVPFEILENTTP